MEQNDTNTAQFLSMSEKKLIKLQPLYSLRDDNVVIVPLEGLSSILHQFVGSYVSWEYEH